MVRWSVGLNESIKRYSKMALVLYCTILLLIPLSYLHIEKSLQDINILTNSQYQDNGLLVLIHEALFAHLCNITDHRNSEAGRILDYLVDQTSKGLFPDAMALQLYLLLPVLQTYFFSAVRICSLRRRKALPHTIFCPRLFEHSPPFFYSS